jgi:hypothetical protein
VFFVNFKINEFWGWSVCGNVVCLGGCDVVKWVGDAGWFCRVVLSAEWLAERGSLCGGAGLGWDSCEEGALG